MRINLKHAIAGRAKIGKKVIDIWNWQIRDELSPESIYKYAIECADKIKFDPIFNVNDDAKLKVEAFYRDLTENVKFISIEPDWINCAKILILKKDPNIMALPKAIIAVPSDDRPSEAKIGTFHETIHFLGGYIVGDILYEDEKLVTIL